MDILVNHNSDSGELTIFSEYSGKPVLHYSTTSIELAHKLEDAIRRAEKAAYSAGCQSVIGAVERALRTKL